MKYQELHGGRYITAGTTRGRVVFVVTESDGTPLYETRIPQPAASETALSPEIEAVLTDLRRRIDEDDFDE